MMRVRLLNVASWQRNVCGCCKPCWFIGTVGRSTMKSFFLVFRQALRRKMILGLLALAVLELVGGGGLLLLTPLCTYAASKCSFSADTASYNEATTNYNPQVPVQTHRMPDINQVFPAQRLPPPKSH